MDTELRQHFGGDGACSYTANGLSAGGASTAPIVTEAIFLIKGVIGMAGAIITGDFAVVPGVLGSVLNQHGNGGAGSPALKDAGENLYLIILFTRGCNLGLTGFSPVQICLDVTLIKMQACRTAIDHDT